MRSFFTPLHGILAVAALFAAPPLRAQPPAVDPATIPMPNLEFTPDADAIGNFDKYYFFNRAATDFATAYGDLQECDGYARGLSYRAGGTYVPVGGLLTGAIGSAIGSAISDAIYGSAERRRLRRVNMRTCMMFKGYRTFGLSKEIWQQFNFEEGNARIEENERQRLLRIQARAASGPAPSVGEVTE